MSVSETETGQSRALSSQPGSMFDAVRPPVDAGPGGTSPEFISIDEGGSDKSKAWLSPPDGGL